MQFGQMIGWVGTALVVIAYLPQIYHLLVQKCAWGISILTWVIWLIGSLMLLVYCILRVDLLFIVVQSINITAIGTTIFLARRSNRICPHHLSVTQKLCDTREMMLN
jgi:lipid-A-disaccharide synthase-like uncharacterized protein